MSVEEARVAGDAEGVLARLAGFDHLPDEDVSLLARMLREETAADGAVIMREGEPGEFLVVILEGEAVQGQGLGAAWRHTLRRLQWDGI